MQNNDHLELLDLYEELERYRRRRDQLAAYLVAFGVGLMLVPFMFGRMGRALTTMPAILSAFIILVFVLGLAGLWLLVQFINNLRQIRDVNEEIRFLKTEERSGAYNKTKRKRKRRKQARYAIGDDGELVRVEELEEENDSTGTHRIQL